MVNNRKLALNYINVDVFGFSFFAGLIKPCHGFQSFLPLRSGSRSTKRYSQMQRNCWNRLNPTSRSFRSTEEVICIVGKNVLYCMFTVCTFLVPKIMLESPEAIKQSHLLLATGIHILWIITGHPEQWRGFTRAKRRAQRAASHRCHRSSHHLYDNYLTFYAHIFNIQYMII